MFPLPDTLPLVGADEPRNQAADDRDPDQEVSAPNGRVERVSEVVRFPS